MAARALERGVLVPIPTTSHLVTDGGATFAVRLAPSLAALPPRPPGPRPNPFLPFDPTLHVADLGPDHVVVLNKYPVIADHLLLITRGFVAQTEPLNPADLSAAVAALEAEDALVFYNAGAEAGASQVHRHLQVLRLPLHPGLPPVPTEALLRDRPPLPLAFAEVDGLDPDAVIRRWPLLVREASLQPQAPGPYNLLLTRRWMVCAPRSREHFDAISINALGVAGSLLVSTPEELALLQSVGPLAVLRAVGLHNEGVRPC